MKKNAKLVSKDGQSRLEITIKFSSSPYALNRDEVKRVVERATNEIFSVVGRLPMTGFGVHNTKVVF